MISLRILQAVIFFGATQIMPDHVSIAAPAVSMASKWHGYFIDNRDFSNSPRNGKWNMEINMEFTNNKQFTATGSDEVGPFTFKDGKIRGGKVSFVKAYMYAGHTIRYEGETKGAQMTGQWWFGTDTKSRGDWAMWPATVQSGETH